MTIVDVRTARTCCCARLPCRQRTLSCSATLRYAAFVGEPVMKWYWSILVTIAIVCIVVIFSRYTEGNDHDTLGGGFAIHFLYPQYLHSHSSCHLWKKRPPRFSFLPVFLRPMVMSHLGHRSFARYAITNIINIGTPTNNDTKTHCSNTITLTSSEPYKITTIDLV